MTNQKVREKLINVLENEGLKLSFIASKLNWNYQNISSFKNGNREYAIERLRELDGFLDTYLS